MLMTSPRVTSNHLRSIGVKALNALVQGLDVAEERAHQREKSGGTRKSYQHQGRLIEAAQAMLAQQISENASSTTADPSMFQAVQQVMAMEIAKYMPASTPVVSPVRGVRARSARLLLQITPEFDREA
jgi:hypothetical protein